MNSLNAYKKQSLVSGWTRIEMLLMIYDRAIGSLEACQAAHRDEDWATLGKHFLDSQKAIAAIHAGLKLEENEVAYNIACLLHFVVVSLEKREFDPAIKVLSELRAGFAAIADEANELERNGEIPPIPADDSFRSIA
jgi:flagellin-specific chaperone FliS